MHFGFYVVLSFVVIGLNDLIEQFFDFDVASGDFFLDLIIGFEFLIQGKEVIFSSVALERFGYFFLTLTAVSMAKSSQFLRVGFPVTDRPDDQQTGESTDVPDDYIESEIEQSEVLLHFLGG